MLYHIMYSVDVCVYLGQVAADGPEVRVLAAPRRPPAQGVQRRAPELLARVLRLRGLISFTYFEASGFHFNF